MKVNEAPRIIIQLMLSAVLFFLYSFKYKDGLLTLLSEQVYYQVLIILVILSGYVAKWIDSLRIFLIHECMMMLSKSYKIKYLKRELEYLTKKTENVNLSNDAKTMMTDITSSDFELEGYIKQMHSEIQKIKR
ncbi:hypothetical protein MC77_020380 [Citrobacter koseri]|uniref:hypothetical protein n=1 Tax=Citrobacter koseri TaxID=545 RepID=UPI0005386CC4|nr:hypothetical protein [Citrobacter koseri]PNO81116.1 hypothetical protein MC77_020380 [Citrobacter koseri]HCT3929863.1 hypothetical protein [Citrobacter koseri]